MAHGKEQMAERQMSDAEIVETQTKGFELLLHWSALISLLPLEEWRQALNRAETLGPVLDPTLFQEYLHSQKPEILKDILEAALKLKAAVAKGQEKVKQANGGIEL